MIPSEDILDPGIEPLVRLLQAHSIATYESCQGGKGHAFVEPTVRFGGNQAEGWRALGVALFHVYPVSELRRVWTVQDGEPVGPHWELTLRHCHPPATSGENGA